MLLNNLQKNQCIYTMHPLCTCGNALHVIYAHNVWVIWHGMRTRDITMNWILQYCKCNSSVVGLWRYVPRYHVAKLTDLTRKISMKAFYYFSLSLYRSVWTAEDAGHEDGLSSLWVKSDLSQDSPHSASNWCPGGPTVRGREGLIGTATPCYIVLQKYIVQSFIAKDNS